MLVIEESAERRRPTCLPRNWKKAYAVSVLSFGCLLNGFSIGFFVPGFKSLLHGNTQDFYGNRFKLGLQDAAWISGLLNLGAAAGYLAGLWVMDKIGRKRFILVNVLEFTVGYVVTFLAYDAAHLFVSRFIVGMAVGGTIAVTGVFIFEIAGEEVHGILGCNLQVMVILGILVSCGIGSCVEWDYLALVFLAFLTPYLIGIVVTPESPHWLTRRGKEFSAALNLEWFEGRCANATTDQKLATIKQKISKEDARGSPSIMSMKHHVKELSVCLVLVMTLQLSGFNVLIYYSVIIFDMAVTSMSPNLASILSLISLLASFAVVVAFTFRLRRKPVLISSMVGMALCQFSLGTYFLFIDETHWYEGRYNQTVNHVDNFLGSYRTAEHDHSWIPIVVTCLCLFLGNTGWFSVTWVVVGEMLPERAHGMANRIIICTAYITAFISTKTFADLVEAVKPQGAFFLYGCVCFLGAFFTLVFVPETKGLSRKNPTFQASVPEYASVPPEAAL